MMQKINIAVADDHALVRRGLISLLETFKNINITGEVENGEALLTLVESDPENIDLILMDLKMPVMDGIQATRVLRRKHPRIKIIIISMHDDSNLILSMIEAGVHGYLLKSSDPEEISTAIQTVMETGNYLSESTSQALYKTFKAGRKPAINYKDNTVFTSREYDVIRLICEGYSNREIGEKLNISMRTVDGHRNNIMAKIEVHSIAGIVMYAVKNGIVI